MRAAGTRSTGRTVPDATLRRLAWAATAVMPVSAVLGVGVRLGDAGGASQELVLLATIVVFPLVGLLILRQHPRNRVGWLLEGVGVVWGTAGLVDVYAAYGLVVAPGSVPGAAVAAALTEGAWAPGIASMGTLLVLLFPDGRLPSPRWRAVAWVSVVAPVLVAVVIAVRPGRSSEGPVPGLVNPLGWQAGEELLQVLLAVLLPLVPLSVLACAVSVVVRFRRSAGVERQQLKWLASAGAVVAFLYLLAMVSTLLVSVTSLPQPAALGALQNACVLSFVLLPLAIGTAVLRHGLYEIDTVINRALVYTGLTTTLLVVYLLMVLMLQLVLAPVTEGSDLAVAGSTLAVAAAFGPARRRIQRLVDRRFYRSRYDAVRTVEEFTARLAAPGRPGRGGGGPAGHHRRPGAARPRVAVAAAVTPGAGAPGRRVSDAALRRWAWVVPLSLLAVATVSVLLPGGAQPSDSEGVGEVGFVLIIVVFPLTGAVILRSQPRNHVGWLLEAIGAVWLVGAATDAWVTLDLFLGAGALPGSGVAAAVNGAIWAPGLGLTGTFLFLLFPDGRLPSRRWRPVAWLAAGTVGLLTAALVVTPGPMAVSPDPARTNPLGWEQAERGLDLAVTVLVVLLPLCILLCVLALAARYRRSEGVARLQLKWLAGAGTVVAVTFLSAIVLPLLVDALSPRDGPPAWLGVLDSLSLLSFVLLPLAIGVAVLRHRLYDIDVVIKRTLVYSLLTATLVVVYLGSVLLLAARSSARSPSSPGSRWRAPPWPWPGCPARHVAGSSCAVDRRFNRSRYDAALVVDGFAARLRHELDVDAVGDQLVSVVERTLRAGRDEPVVPAVTLAGRWWPRKGRTMTTLTETPRRRLVGRLLPGRARAEQERPEAPAAGDRAPAGTAGDPAAGDRHRPRTTRCSLFLAERQRRGRCRPAPRWTPRRPGPMKAAGVKLVVPLVSQGELIGVLNLGARPLGAGVLRGRPEAARLRSPPRPPRPCGSGSSSGSSRPRPGPASASSRSWRSPA